MMATKKRISSGIERVSRFLSDRAKDKKMLQEGKARIIEAKTKRELGRTDQYYKTKRFKNLTRRAAQIAGSAFASNATTSIAQAQAQAKADNAVSIWNSVINGNAPSASSNENTSETADQAVPTTVVGGGLRE